MQDKGALKPQGSELTGAGGPSWSAGEGRDAYRGQRTLLVSGPSVQSVRCVCVSVPALDPALVGGVFITSIPGLSVLYRSVVFNSCNPIDCSLPGSSVHGILQPRILEWIVISFYRGSS